MTLLERGLRCVRRQDGLALPMAIGMMMVFAIAVSTVVVFSSSSQHDADAQRKNQTAYGSAEAALATAISVLATMPDPTVSSALPSCASPATITVSGATGDYCGVLSGMDWTVTARGFATGTSAQVGQLKPKVITQVASVVPVNSGGLGQLWNRIYQYDTSKCVLIQKMIIAVPLVTRSCVSLKGNSSFPSQLIGSYVAIGGNVDLDDSDSIGLAATPVERVDIAGTCDLKHGSGPHSPCGPVDRVYGNTVTATPTDLARPSVNFPYWYANAKPGPMYPCTVGALPPGTGFDTDTAYNGNAKTFDLTPTSSYSCQYWAGGKLLGELSWNEATGVLTIEGAIFFDGDLIAKDKTQVTDYQGRGTIYTSGKVDIEETICAGGDGSNDCEGDMTDWDPTQNTLVFITGGLLGVSTDAFTMNKDEAVFQGAVWSQGKCKLGKKASVSAPLICGQLGIKENSGDDPDINAWPASLIGSSGGQVYPNPAGDFQILLRDQVGG